MKYLLGLIVFISFGLHAQDSQVTGTVTDNEGMTLPGVTILVAGTTNGTITDLDGSYTLKVPANAVLEFSFVGFISQSIPVGGKSVIDVQLEMDIVQMDEVVVVGYGTVEKKDLTGSVAILSEEDLALQPVIRMESALQAKVPGVMVNQNSGNPGAGLKVRIRGVNSFGGNNGPLYVIDGFLGADPQSINPNDIQSITVLKDASASAIYGSQAAGGVVIITTRQGKANDKPQINVNYQHSISQLRRKLDLMEGWQYMQTVNDKLTAGGTAEENLLFTRRQILEAQSQGLGTDWQDVVFQPGMQDLVELSVNKGAFFLSTAAQWNRGIVTGTEYNRYNLRLNYSENIFDKVKLFLSISNSFEDRFNAGDDEHISIIRTAAGWAPNLSVIDTLSGDYTRNPSYGPLQVNPAFSLYETPVRAFRDDFLANGFLEFKLMDGLTFKSQGSVNLRGVSQTSFSRVSPNIVANNPDASSYGNNHSTMFAWQAFQQLAYKKTFGIHGLDAMAVYEARSVVNRSFSAGGSNMPTTDLGYYSAKVANIFTNGSDRDNTERWSLLGRVNYSLKDKYLFTVNVRHDENSRLAAGYEGANFYGGAFAYRLSEESFMQNIDAIEEMKLRLSYGELGSESVGFTETIELVNYNKGYSFDGLGFVRGTGLPNPRNSRLTWEITRQWDAGVDLSLFDGRYTIILDGFYKVTSDLHFTQLVPAYAGGGNIKVNSGEMENKGLELAVSGYAIDRGDFSVEINANASFYRNKLLDFAGESEYIVSGLNQQNTPDLLDNTHRSFRGEPVGLLWGLIYDGVYSTDQAAESAQYNRSPGDPIYRDLNTDGKIDNADMTVIGNPNPDYSWGLTSNIRYKAFTLNMVWNGVHGVDILNSMKYWTYGGARDATSVDILNRWTPENQNTDIPGFTATSVLYRQSSQWIEDGSYVKLRNITLKYDIPARTLSSIKGPSSISVFVTGQNLLVLTKYTGYDPESLSSTGDRAGGFDEGGYPIPRTILTGIKVKF